MMAKSSPLIVFVSYAHADEDYCRELMAALQPLEKTFPMKVWSDRAIAPGVDYFDAVLSNLGAAKIVLLLVTDNFLRSDATRVEVEYALAKHKTGQSRVIPIIVEDCAWRDSPLASLQALPPGLTPVAESGDNAKFWSEIASGVARAVKELAQPQRNPEYELFSNADLIEMIQECNGAIATIKRAYNPIGGPDDRTLLKLAQIEKKRDSFKYELAARIGITERPEHARPHGDISKVLAEQVTKSGGTINADQLAVGENAQTHKVTQTTSRPDTVRTDVTRLKILFLAANPIDTAQLRLDKEIREVDEALRRAQLRDQFVLEQKPAVRIRDLRRAMLDTNPDIVHFSGHGLTDGLVLESQEGKAQIVENEALADLFELFKGQVKCVVLNACYSASQADVISQHIDYVIGMNQPLGDQAAIEFTIGFYDALCAGRSYFEAYKFGRNAIQLSGISERLTPVLHTKAG